MGFPDLITMMRAQAMMGRGTPGDELDKDGANSPGMRTADLMAAGPNAPGMQAADAQAAMPVGLARQASPMISHKDDTESEQLDKDKASNTPVAESHVGDVRTADVGDFGLDAAGGSQTPPKDRPGDAESDKPGEPGSDDIHSTLSALIKNASMEGPSVAAYREMLTKMPTRDKNGPKAIDRIGAALSGISAGWFHPGTGFRVAQQQVEAPYAEAMGDYQAKLHDLAVGANLEQSGKNKLAALAGNLSYRDVLTQSRKDALKLNEDRTKSLIQSREDAKTRADAAAAEKKREFDEMQKNRELTRAEIAQRDAESRRVHDVQIADIKEKTANRQQQEEARGQQERDEDVINQARSLGYTPPSDPKTGREFVTKDTPNEAALYVAQKEAMRGPFSHVFEESEPDKDNNTHIQLKAGVTPEDKSAAGAWVFNRIKQLRPHTKAAATNQPGPYDIPLGQ